MRSQMLDLDRRLKPYAARELRFAAAGFVLSRARHFQTILTYDRVSVPTAIVPGLFTDEQLQRATLLSPTIRNSIALPALLMLNGSAHRIP
jgi:hypothetical protein